MYEVIVPLIKRGGQEEKKSAQVLTLGGRGRAGAGTAERDITGGELEAHLKVGRARDQGG